MAVDRSSPANVQPAQKNGFFGRTLFPIFILLGGVTVFLTTELGRWFAPRSTAEAEPEWRNAQVSADVKTNEPSEPQGAPDTPAVHRLNSLAWGIGLSLIPFFLLAGIIAVFITTHGGGTLATQNGEAAMLLFDRTVLQPGQFALHVRNSSLQPMTIATANVNDAIIPYVIKPAGPIPPLGSATVYLLYPWVEGQAYEITLSTRDSASFKTSVSDAEATSPPTPKTIRILLLVGLAAGLLPVLCGITWFPAITRAGPGLFLFLLAVAGGLLIYTGIALADQTLKNLPQVDGAFQGIGMLAVSFALAFLFLNAVSGVGSSLGMGQRSHRSAQAWIKAAGVGLQNFAAALAVGAAFSSDSAVLGTIFIMALIILNLTQGLRIIASMEKNERSFTWLLGTGVLAGAPAVLGIWLGFMTSSQMAFLLFYTIGAGAIVQALVEVIQRIRQSTTHQPMPVTIFAGFAAGMLALYMASILIA
jgi:zinc transporter, ZIP family